MGCNEQQSEKTNLVSILYNLRHEMTIHIGHSPLNNLLNKHRPFFLNALYSQCTRECKQRNDPTPFDTVTKQFMYDCHER